MSVVGCVPRGCLLGALAGLDRGGDICDPGLRELGVDGLMDCDLGLPILRTYVWFGVWLSPAWVIPVGVDSLALHGCFRI